MCFFKEDLCENADPQTSQENGFSPVGVHMWHLKEHLSEKATSQENGTSPV